MAYELEELIPIMDSIWTVLSQTLFTHIPGNHDASEACPLVDAGRSEGKLNRPEKRKVK